MEPMRITRVVALASIAFGLFLTLNGCGEEPQAIFEGEELTGKTSSERALTFKSYVYVEENASATKIFETVQSQARSAFGPLRIGKIATDDREFRNNLKPATFTTEKVALVEPDTAAPATGNSKTPALRVVKNLLRVNYTYEARAIAPNRAAATFAMALLNGDYNTYGKELVQQCTEKPEEDGEWADTFWYVWSPNVKTCKEIISTEAKAVSASLKKLDSNQISREEFNRRFLPLKAELKAVDAPKTAYPEYDQLYGLKGPAKDKIIVNFLAGTIAHDGDSADKINENDPGVTEFFNAIYVLTQNIRNLKIAADSPVQLFKINFKGKTYEADPTLIYHWMVLVDSFPPDVAAADQQAFRKAIYALINGRSIKFEAPLVIGGGRLAPKNIMLQINMTYGLTGSSSSISTFKNAFRTGDVVVYNGHSYIGSGPMDPNNYSAADFKAGYQIIFFNSCVSFNYYGVKYFDLKAGGTANLDLVTNGLESRVKDNGIATASFVAALFNGRLFSWADMIAASLVKQLGGTHDPNRNVDGEQDNAYLPSTTPISISAAPQTN